MSNRQITPAASILIKGQKFFENERNWCQNESYRRVGFFRQRVQYCALGYIERTIPHGIAQTWAIFHLDEAAHQLYGTNVVSVNDVKGREAVVACYRLAASRALSKQH